MKPIKLIQSIGDDYGKPEGYGIIMSDGTHAEIVYFDKYGNPKDRTVQYCRHMFKIYCEKNNLKQL